MKNFLIKKPFLIFLLIILFIFPPITFAEDSEEIKPEEIKEHLELSDKDAQKIMETLNKILTNKKIDLLSSENPDPRETTVVEILRKGARIEVANRILIDAPIEIVGNIMKYAIEIAQIILAKNVSLEFWKKYEEETVKKAVKYGMKALLENEIKITPGVLNYSYPSYKGNKQEVAIQYLIIYKPTAPKEGKVEIRFYSPVTIEPPMPRGWFLTGTYHELEGDLQPFITEISGEVKNFKWAGIPSVNTTFPEEVPDLGIRPMGFWDRNVVKPIKNEIKETGFVFEKISGKTSEVKEKIQSFGEGAVSNIEDALKGIKTKTENLWQKLKEKTSQFNPLGAAVGFFSGNKKTAVLESSLKEKESELEKLRQKISQLEEKLDTGEELNSELQLGYESEISGLNTQLDSLNRTIEDLNQQLAGQTTEDSKKESAETVGEEKTEQEVETESETTEEIIICQRKEGDLPKRNKIIFNEIAWMGTENSANDEWIELKNISGSEIDLTGWQILNKDQKIKIVFDIGQTYVKLNTLLILERTNDETVPGITADLIYTGALKNSDETLYLFDENCQLQDEVLASPDWPAGDKSSKRTMERKNDLSWQTSSNIGGTPKSQNSSGYFSTSGGGGGGTISGTSGGSTTSTPTYCSQENLSSSSHLPVIINEVAWMGTSTSSSNEWIELKNISNNEINLAGWQLLDKDKEIKIIFSSGGLSSANSFYLLERTDDNSVPGILADKTYTGNLEDSNESLRLFDQNCNLIDEVIANPNWPAGEPGERKSMERNEDLSWHSYFGDTADPLSGLMATPKAENSAEVGPPQTPQTQKILINEIQIEGKTSKDEFIELFNSLNEEVDLTGFSLKKKTATGSESNLVSSDKFSGTISTGGYFLIVPQTKDDGTPNYQGEAPPDFFYSGKTYSIAANNTVLLYDSNNNLIDKVGFGQVQDFENSPFPQNPSKNQSLGRKWIEINQNHQDTNSNQEDFEIQPPTPKARNEELKSQSNLEVSPNTLEFLVDFGKNPKSQILTLDSDTILNWKASIEYSSPFEEVNWLRSIPNSGKTPSQILVSAFVSDLTPGEYQAFLNIESEAQNSPLKIPVNLSLIPTEIFASIDHLLISEVQLADNEFVELYNPTDSDIDVSDWYFSYFPATRDEEGNPKYNWNNPYRNKKFPDGTIILSKNHFLIGLKGYPDSGWTLPEGSVQLSNTAGSVAIFSCDPKNTEENPKTIEEAISCKIDALGWGETIAKETESTNPAPAEKSLARKLGINQQGELNYIDTDNNQSDFEIQEISPKKLNFHSFSDSDKDGILDLFDEETVLDGEISLDANEYEFKNLKILENSKLIFNSDSSVEGFKGVKINAQNLVLEENSQISADAKGYPAKEGPGAGKVGQTGGGSCSGYNSVSYGSGGGYGGIGGQGGYPSCSEFIEGDISYGFLELPLDLGSGGGNENGGRGGGGIIIDVVEKINLDGQISANGEDVNGGYYSNSGGGSGGGVLISTNILEGAGKIIANGGNGKADCCGGGGGGGRIAIYYNLMENFTGEIDAFGGQGFKSGGAGTIFLKSFEKELGDLTIDNGNFEGFTNLERDLGFDNFRVSNSAYLHLPEKLSANYLEIEKATLESNTQTEIEASQINLSENSLIILPEEEFLKIKVNNLVLQSESKIISNLDIESEEISLDLTSAILADGKGFSAGQGLGSGKVGQTGGGSCSGYNYCWFGSGGGYGGQGGQGSYSSCGAVVDGGISFGDLKMPIDFGSGGGGDTAGAGGGAIQIVTNTLTLNGRISADGENGKILGACGGSGGGSGGSIFIKTNILEGVGLISANGGSGYDNLGGGGAGGRIAIYYDSKDSFSSNIQAFGGQGFKSGGAGTIFLKSPTQTSGDLIIDNNNFSGVTQLAENYTFDNLEVLNSSHLYLSENLIVTNLEVGNNSTLAALDTATINANQFLISQNSSLFGPSQIFVTINSENLSLQSESKIIANVEINTGDILIDSTSAILADGKGYSGGQGPGAGKEAETGGGSCSGYSYCWVGSGGGYGGQGGEGSYSSCGVTAEGGLSYGSEETPIDFGSGGGSQGGAGGGAIKINVINDFALNGSLSVDGENGKVFSACGGSGGGSGGSIYITTNIFEGSGQIRADGGQGYDGLGGGGAGGRIAIYSQTNNFQGIVQVEGGAAGYEAGQDGTVHLGE